MPETSTEAIWRNSKVETIIADLRKEVDEQKECITKYTFQALAFVSGVWGLVFNAGGVGLPFYFCNALLIFTLLAVARMANHKYSTMNRNLGYELHLNRLKDYAGGGKHEW